jgi:multiple sugar transport system permease protein
MATHAVSRSRRRGLQAQRARLFYILVLPWMIGLLAFTVGPMLYSLYISLTQWNLIQAPKFVGLGNYTYMLHDPLFWKALEVTVLYAVVTVPLGLAFSLGIAVLLNQKVRGLSIFRTIFYLPSVVSGVAVSVLFLWIFNPQFGLANSVLSYFGIRGPGWIESPNWALPSLIIMSLWSLGGPMLIFLAGLQNVPAELLDAASVEGAGRLQRFWRVTIPLLTPTILFNVVISIIAQFQTFTQAYVITDGGPVHATLFYVFYLYQVGFQNLEMGYASALTWVLFLILLVVAMLVMKTSGRWVFYQGERQ